MFSSLVALATLFATPPDTPERPSYLFNATEAPARGQRYQPRSGDLLLFDDHSEVMAALYRFGGTDGPLHAGVVFQRKDGRFAVLEAGTNAVMKVFVFDLETRLHDFYGTILVRQLRKPLSDEQTAQLADFALAQEGKGYAMGRVAWQIVTFRARRGIRADLFGRTVLDRERWYCSELAAAATVAAGVVDGHEYPANAMSPRDLCYDERFDFSPYYHAPALWYPRPELERVGKGVRVIEPGER